MLLVSGSKFWASLPLNPVARLTSRLDVDAPMDPLPQRSSERELQNLIPPSPAVRPLWGQNREEAAMPQAQHNQDWYGWTPVFLRKKPLIGLLSGFLLILLAIVALAVVDSKHAGVSSADSNIYYLWTYGTTAGMSPNHQIVSG